MKEKWKKIWNIVSTSLLIAFFVLAAGVLILTIAVKAGSKNGVTWLFGYGMFQIVSGSMEPEIHVGDVVVGKKAGGETLAVGDTIVYERDGMLITHKIVRINGDGTVTTQGVNNNVEDAPVALERIVAKQAFVLRGLGGALNFLRSTAGFLLVIFLPLTGFVLYESVSLMRALKRYRAEKVAEESGEAELTAEIERLKHELDKKGNGTKAGENQRDDGEDQSRK